VLSNKEVLGVLKPGEHGSTFGGNPLACAVARAALKVLVEEGMIDNAARPGRATARPGPARHRRAVR
jgi:ornithine--oxo-acid transaminase